MWDVAMLKNGSRKREAHGTGYWILVGEMDRLQRMRNRGWQRSQEEGALPRLEG